MIPLINTHCVRPGPPNISVHCPDPLTYGVAINLTLKQGQADQGSVTGSRSENEQKEI